MKSFQYAKVLLIVTLFMSATPLFAATELQLPASKGHVEFEATGRPSMIKIKGHSDSLESKLRVEKNGSQNELSGEAKLPLSTLKTGIDMRDEHMNNKYLQVGQYPDAILKIEKLILPDSWTTKNPQLKDFPFKGLLKMHGVEKEITGTVNVENAQLKTEADFEISILDYGIEIPSYLGIKVADKVKLKIQFAELQVKETDVVSAVKKGK